MSLECHETWCHMLTSLSVEKDVKIPWKCHDILMEFNRILRRKRHPCKMPWKCHEIPMSFNGIKNLGSFWWDFYWKKNLGTVMEFDIIFDQNFDGNYWRHFIMRGCRRIGRFRLGKGEMGSRVDRESCTRITWSHSTTHAYREDKTP